MPERTTPPRFQTCVFPWCNWISAWLWKLLLQDGEHCPTPFKTAHCINVIQMCEHPFVTRSLAWSCKKSRGADVMQKALASSATGATLHLAIISIRPDAKITLNTSSAIFQASFISNHTETFFHHETKNALCGIDSSSVTSSCQKIRLTCLLSMLLGPFKRHVETPSPDASK